MRRIVLPAVFLVLFTLPPRICPAAGTEVGYSRKLGLGLMLGEPTGITGKYWVGLRNALDFGFGFGFYGRTCDRYGCYGDYQGASINGDYLWHPSVVARSQTAEVDWHVGVGARMWFLDTGNRYSDHGGITDLAVRVPVGLDVMFNNPSFLELYGELTPSFLLYDGHFNPELSIGIRFYF